MTQSVTGAKKGSALYARMSSKYTARLVGVVEASHFGKEVVGPFKAVEVAMEV